MDFSLNSDLQRYNNLLWYIKNYNLKGLYAYLDTVNEAIFIMNIYRAATDTGTSSCHTTWTYIGVYFEQVQGPSAA